VSKTFSKNANITVYGDIVDDMYFVVDSGALSTQTRVELSQPGQLARGGAARVLAHLRSLRNQHLDSSGRPSEIHLYTALGSIVRKYFILDQDHNVISLLSYDGKELQEAFADDNKLARRNAIYDVYAEYTRYSNLVIVDYGKGTVTEASLENVFANKNLRHIVVSCKKDFQKYYKFSGDQRMVVVCNCQEWQANEVLLSHFPHVVVTMDKLGAKYMDYGRIQAGVRHELGGIKVCSDIGAGDAFTSAFTLTLASNRRETTSCSLLEAAMQNGVNWATFSIQYPPWMSYSAKVAAAYSVHEFAAITDRGY